MKNSIRKILNMVMVFVFFSHTVLMGDILDDAVNNMSSDVITLKSFTEPDGTQNYYTGSMSIRFDQTVTPGPLFSFTPPSIEAGCSGLDIKGMFLSLLGLEQLKDMLFNAGTTLAWGVAVGLIYTLPGIASAFKFINGWAKKIQDLLADACNAGQEIGRWAGEQAGLDQLSFDNIINQSILDVDMASYLGAKQKGHSAILEAMGWYDGDTPELSSDRKEDAVVSLVKGVFESDASMLGGIIEDLAYKANPGSMLSTLGGGKNGAIKENKVIINDVKANEIASLVGTTGSLTGVSTAKLSIFSYVLIYNFVGDLAMDIGRVGSFDKVYNAISKDSGAVAQYEALKDTKQDTLSLISGVGGQGDAEAKAKKLAEYIWYGTERAQASSNMSETVINKKTQNEALIAPVLNVYTLSDKSSNGKNSFITVFSKDSNKEKPAYFTTGTTYKGSVMESKCVIDALVNESGILDVNGQKDVALAKCQSGVILPELYKYVKIIKNSPEIEQYRLKNLLVKVMSIKMANAILASVGESLGHIQTSTGSSIDVSKTGTGGKKVGTKSTVKEVLKHKELINEVIFKSGLYLEDKLAGEAAIESKVDSAFDIQARKNRERGLKSTQK